MLELLHIFLSVMKLKNRRLEYSNDDINVPRLIVIIALLCIGAAVGSFFGAGVNGQEDWFWEYTNLTPQQFFRRDAVLNLILVAIVFIGGFTPIGFIPSIVVILIKGAVSALPISAFIRLYGVSGYFSAAKTGMVSNFFSVFALCLMVYEAVESSALRRNRINDKTAERDKQYVLSFCICVAIVVFGSALDGFLL